jgi:hypothetical protein
MGIDPDKMRAKAHKPIDRAKVWPDMIEAVGLFLAMTTQWRWTGAGMAGMFRTGLDYGVLNRTAENINVEMTPGLFADIRSLEAAALSAWSGNG